MARRRRAVEVFTLSFLDCICCGFGAVILFYTIVSARAGAVSIDSTNALRAEVNRLDQQVLTGSRHLVVLHNELQKTASETASDISRSRAIEQGERRFDATSLDVAPPGQQTIGFRAVGGDRRYITGIRMRGKHILILLDMSASMLHEDLVTVLRLRSSDDAQKRAAAKWRRAIDTVYWLITQIPAGSEYQVYVFNTQARALLADSAGKWIPAGDAPRLARELANLHVIVPGDGTSLYNAFATAQSVAPSPDQIVLITDGLPTQGRTASSHKYVDSEARLRLFDEAAQELPDNVPVDTLLLPMKGDPQAAHRFWSLARATRGTLLMPSKDWP